MTQARPPYPPPPRPGDGAGPPPTPPPTPQDLIAARLEHFAASTTVLPRPDLHARVLGRLAEEPRTSAPRRFRAALIALDVAAAIRAFRQVVATVVAGRPTGSGPRASVAVRAQALALVLVVVSVVTLAGAAGGVGAVAGIAAIIDGEGVTQPDVPAVALPTPGPIDDAPAVVEVSTPEPTAEPTPEPTAEPTPSAPPARPATREATPKPTPTDRKPRATTRPSKDDGDSSDRSDDREGSDDSDDEKDERDERDEED